SAATHVQSTPPSTVFASRRQRASPQSESPSTQPTEGEMKVTDSGCIARDDNPLVCGGGAALGVCDCDGMLINGEGMGEVLVVARGCASPGAQPTRATMESAATGPRLRRRTKTTSGAAGVKGAQPAVSATSDSNFGIRGSYKGRMR